MFDKTSAMVVEANKRMEDCRRERNFAVNNAEIVLTLPRGQIEFERREEEIDEDADFNPLLKGAVLLTDSVVDKLNHDIAVSSSMFFNPLKTFKGHLLFSAWASPS